MDYTFTIIDMIMRLKSRKKKMIYIFEGDEYSLHFDPDEKIILSEKDNILVEYKHKMDLYMMAYLISLYHPNEKIFVPKPKEIDEYLEVKWEIGKPIKELPKTKLTVFTIIIMLLKDSTREYEYGYAYNYETKEQNIPYYDIEFEIGRYRMRFMPDHKMPEKDPSIFFLILDRIHIYNCNKSCHDIFLKLAEKIPSPKTIIKDLRKSKEKKKK